MVFWIDLFPLLATFKVTKPVAVTFVCVLLLASVGLSFSGSHDPVEIACEIACNLQIYYLQSCYLQSCYLQVCDMRPSDAGDEATSESP